MYIRMIAAIVQSSALQLRDYYAKSRKAQQTGEF
jgi:hypothetical protein